MGLGFAVLQHELVSMTAVPLEGSQLPLPCAGQPKLPTKPGCILLPVTCHRSPRQDKIRRFCVIFTVDIEPSVASPINHADNRGQTVYPQFPPFAFRDDAPPLQTTAVTADQGLISWPCCVSSIIQSVPAGTLDSYQRHSASLSVLRRMFRKRCQKYLFSSTGTA